MVDPTVQDFLPRIHMLKRFYLNNPTMNNGTSKSAKIVLSKSNFLCQISMDFSKKKIHLRVSI